MTLPFSKYHGLGNDFIVLDLRDAARADAATPAPHTDDFVGATAVRLCDRHRGVGADGLLLFTGSPAEPRMRVVNADGSVPEMCGNGLRCFVKHVVDRFGITGSSVTVSTDAGALACTFDRGADGRVTHVSVAMGTPSYAPERVPTATATPLIDHALEVDGVTLHITGVGTGNPHLVLFDALTDAQRQRLGPVLSAHPLFPAQANVEFCTVLSPAAGPAAETSPAVETSPATETSPAAVASPTQLRCDVYERGCGWTQACGTGATAAATVAVRLGRVPQGHPVHVRLPGGWLVIDVSPEGAAIMTGPAEHVFDGVLPG